MLYLFQGPGGQVYPRRLAPYPSPAMHMTQKRQQQVSAYPSPGPNPSMQPGFPPSGPQVRALALLWHLILKTGVERQHCILKKKYYPLKHNLHRWSSYLLIPEI